MGTAQIFEERIVETPLNTLDSKCSAINEVEDTLSDAEQIIIEVSENNAETASISDEAPRLGRLGQVLTSSKPADDTEENPPVPYLMTAMHTSPDAISVASLSSSSSTSSCGSGCLDPRRNQLLIGREPTFVKKFGPATGNGNINHVLNPVHPRIRRVPSTANPKYKIPALSKGVRSKSQPQLKIHSTQSQRRHSSPPQLPQHGSLLNILNATANMAPTPQQLPPSKVNPQQNSPKSTQPSIPAHQLCYQQDSELPQQQQVIYLQIPQPLQAQMCDQEAVQRQISSQLQLLVPQIYNQLLNQINAKPEIPMPSSRGYSNQNSPKAKKEQTQQEINNKVQSQRLLNQLLENSVSPTKLTSNQQKNQHKKPAQTTPKSPPVGTAKEVEDDIREYLRIESISQILQQIPPHILQQNLSSPQTSFIEIQKLPGYPKITIPITQELVVQCQQYYKQQADQGFAPYQPSLETILEESLSVKQLKVNNKFPRTKIIACILSILCVVVVVLLAGDKTIAVVVVAVIFLVFLMAAIFYLYINSSKNQPTLAPSNSQRIQVNAISSCHKTPPV